MNKISIYQVSLLLGLLFSFSACEKDDDGNGTQSDSSINQWIDKTMRDWYLWYDEIPDKGKLNYNATPEAFFKSLLVQKDGKNFNGAHYFYSTIEKKKAATRGSMGESPTLGFEYQLYYITNLGKNMINVLYVLPNSPAAKGGMKRGDWIQTMNGAELSSNSYLNLDGNSSVRLGIADYINKPVTRTVSLTPEMVADNPVFLDTVYTYRNTKIGYLVYNHFTAGLSDTSEEYNNSLRASFAAFKAAGVTEFILDLRYNGGGLVTSAQLLATMLAPASALGQVFCHLQYNKKHTSSNHSLALDAGYMNKGVAGANLDLSRLYVIMSSSTASASEAVINGLAPFIPLHSSLILVGEPSNGKNVGSITLENSKYNYKLHPIVCTIYNKDNQTDYDKGFLPTDNTLEEGPIERGAELGDIDREVLLKATLGKMFNAPVASSVPTRSTGDNALIPVYNSLDRKRTNGVRIPTMITDPSLFE